MSEKTTHEEILDLLANKKITIDQAMQMLSGGDKPEVSAGTGKTENIADAEALKIDEDEPVFVADSEPSQAAEEGLSAPDRWPAKPASNGGDRANWLQIRVRDLDSGRNRVTVNLPLMMVKFGLNIARRFGAESEEIDFGQLATQLRDAEPGVLIDVEDEDSNEHVQIVLA